MGKEDFEELFVVDSLAATVLGDGKILLFKNGEKVPYYLRHAPGHEVAGLLELSESEALAVLRMLQAARSGSDLTANNLEVCIHEESGMPAFRVMLADGDYGIEFPVPPSHARRFADALRAFADEAEANGVTG